MFQVGGLEAVAAVFGANMTVKEFNQVSEVNVLTQSSIRCFLYPTLHSRLPHAPFAAEKTDSVPTHVLDSRSLVAPTLTLTLFIQVACLLLTVADEVSTHQELVIVPQGEGRFGPCIRASLDLARRQLRGLFGGHLAEDV